MISNMTNRITLGNLTIDRNRYETWVDGQRVELTYVEFELLFRQEAAGSYLSAAQEDIGKPPLADQHHPEAEATPSLTSNALLGSLPGE